MTIDDIKKEVIKGIQYGFLYNVHDCISYIIALNGFIDENLYIWCLNLKMEELEEWIMRSNKE